MSFNIAFVLYPDFEELDLAGPFEVFGVTAKWLDKEWRVFTVAAERNVRAVNGLNVQADYVLSDAPRADVVLVPGGTGSDAAMKDSKLIGYIKQAGSQATYVTSVCTGAFLLHKAGFLEGKRASTYWRSRDDLRALGGITVVDERWVHDGNVVTSAGVSAGIDMALYLLGMLKTPEFARTVQQLIEYDPAPPYADVPAQLE